MISGRAALLAAVAGFGIAVPAVADDVDAGSDSESFFGQAEEIVGPTSIQKPQPQSDHPSRDSESGRAPKPRCGSVISEECIPVTECVPFPDSPTGYMLQTIFDFSPTSQDFSFGGPCTPSEAQAARPSLPALVLRAFERVLLPEPVLSIQPPKGKTLVGLETIFSTQAEPFTRTLNLLGRRVELRIEASDFTWVHGDGTTQSTDWAGKAWDRDEPEIGGYVTHVYEHTGRVQPRVRVTWSAEYRVDGGAWQAVDGTVSREGAPAELSVLEGEPVLNSY